MHALTLRKLRECSSPWKTTRGKEKMDSSCAQYSKNKATHWYEKHLSPGPTWLNSFPIVHDRDKISNHEQSETNRNDENAMCDY